MRQALVFSREYLSSVLLEFCGSFNTVEHHGTSTTYLHLESLYQVIPYANHKVNKGTKVDIKSQKAFYRFKGIPSKYSKRAQAQARQIRWAEVLETAYPTRKQKQRQTDQIPD